MIDLGNGPPVVLIPGIQGRWEWLAPTIEALSKRCRVVTSSLPGDVGSLHPIKLLNGFDDYITYIDELLDRASLKCAALCGVSYGGWIAVHYAARRPNRVSSLTLVSPPSPDGIKGRRVKWYLRAPRLLSPLFALSSPFRLYPEIAAAIPELCVRARFIWQHLQRVSRHPFVPLRMAERIQMAHQIDFRKECAIIEVPTLVVTGENQFDHVVPLSNSLEYIDSITNAHHVEIPGTGHIGLVTKPNLFAKITSDFVEIHSAMNTSVKISV